MLLFGAIGVRGALQIDLIRQVSSSPRRKSGVQSKWGRHCCRPHSHLRVGASFLAFGPGEPFLLPSPLRTWRPVSNPRPAASFMFHPCGLPLSVAALLRGSSPALAPASDFASRCWLHFTWAETLAPLVRLLGIAEAAILGLASRTLVSDCPKALTQQLLPAITTALNGCFASHSSQTIRLAFDRGLVHSVSQAARGQQPPYPCFEKTFVKSVPCGSSFGSLFRPEDTLKLRPDWLFRKAGKSDLSTFPQITCGGRWTTQPFIAFGQLNGNRWCGRDPPEVLFKKRNFSNLAS